MMRDAITGEPVDGLPDRVEPTSIRFIDDDRMFRDMVLGIEPDDTLTDYERLIQANYRLWYEDPDHWCKKSQDLKRRVEQLENSRAWWIIGLVVVIGIMAFYIWDRNAYISDLWDTLRDNHKTICELVKKLPSETEVSDHEGCED